MSHCILCDEDFYPASYYDPLEPCLCKGDYKTLSDLWEERRWSGLLDLLCARTAKLCWTLGTKVWDWRMG